MRNFYLYVLFLDTAANTAILLEYTWLPLCLCEVSTFHSYKYVGTPASLNIVAFFASPLKCQNKCPLFFLAAIPLLNFLREIQDIFHGLGGRKGEIKKLAVCFSLNHSCVNTEMDFLE